MAVSGKIKKRIIIIGKEDFEGVLENNKFIEKRSINKIEELVDFMDFDEIRICEMPKDIIQLNLIMYLMGNLKIDVTFSPSIYHKLVEGSIKGDNTLLFFRTFLGKRSDGEEFLIKCLDLVGSFILLLMGIPLILVIAVLIRLTSSGPVFYKQKRFGKDGKTFTLYKFRTMVEDAEKISGFQPSAKNDSRITKIGAILRQTRLDELPQFFNVLKGEMSLVGPRPENVYRVKTHKALQGMRLAVKPGLTGLAQIRSYYDLHPNRKIKYDYLYIQKRSFLLHLYLMMKTIPIVLLRRGT